MSVEGQNGSWLYRFRYELGPPRLTIEKGSDIVNILIIN